MEYRCRLGSASGEIKEGVYAAENETQLRQEFEDKGLFLLSVQQSRRAISWKGVSLPTRRRLGSREFIVFNQELAALLNAGMPLVQSLDLLRQRVEQPVFKALLDDVHDQVQSGSALSDAFETHRELVPGVYIASVLAGEQSGGLEEMLRRYITYAKILDSVRRKTASALIYPAILFTLSAFVVGIIVLQVVPEFASFYEGMGASLPLATRLLMTVSYATREFFWVLFFGVTAAGFGMWNYARHSNRREWLDRSLLRLPFIGSVVNKFSTSQLARTLATLLGGGVPLVNALDVASRSISNRYLSQQLVTIAQEVREGQPLSTAMKSRTAFPSVAIKMVEVGESTGALQQMLNSVADFFDEEVETTLARFMTLIEPILLVIMGIVIAALLLSLYWPLLQLGAIV